MSSNIFDWVWILYYTFLITTLALKLIVIKKDKIARLLSSCIKKDTKCQFIFNEL